VLPGFEISEKTIALVNELATLGKGEYVTGLEPGTHPPIGQAKAREQEELIFLQPGETRAYNLEIEVLEKQEKINEFLTNNLG
jgi:hypothetical protein